MKLTRAGLGVVVASVLSFALGRIFGALEAHLLAAVGAATLALGAIYTALTKLEVRVERQATPSRLRVGIPARVDLALTNRRSRPTPVLRADDRFNGHAGASLYLAPIGPGETSRIAYRLPTTRRGELTIGPLDLTMGDPLGLTRTTNRASGQVRLVVRAPLMDLGVLTATAGHDPTADLQPVRALATSGNEFFALRPYVVGDELRRVHWRSSARTGDLVVRQEEQPRSGRVTVVLDRAAGAHDSDSFDRACSVAISTLYAGWRSDDALRFLTTSPGSLAEIRSRQELDAVDEQLALLTTVGDASLTRAIDDLARLGRGGTVVLITGSTSPELVAATERARRIFGIVLPVVCRLDSGSNGAAPVDHAGPGPTIPPAAAAHLVHDGSADFAARWRAALG